MIHFKIKIKMPIKGSQNEYNIYLLGWLIYICLYSKLDRVNTNIEDSFPSGSKLTLKILFSVVKF